MTDLDCTCQRYEGRNCRRCFDPPYPDQSGPPRFIVEWLEAGPDGITRIRESLAEQNNWAERAIDEFGIIDRKAWESIRLQEKNLPSGCYCKPGCCMAPVIMGRQMPCRDLAKAALPPLED